MKQQRHRACEQTKSKQNKTESRRTQSDYVFYCLI